MRKAPFLLLLAAGSILSLSAAIGQPSSSAASQVIQLDLSGVVDPFTAEYVRSGLDAARAGGASAVLITIDTPGGLNTSMRSITQAILQSEVPVICYVAPAGARAASAGTFILMSCPVAAMAPGTNVGAAQPVGLEGAVASEKAVNDAAAHLRSLAQTYGRNEEWAEAAVTASSSLTAEEAVEKGVVDVLASSTDALFSMLNGRSITLGNGSGVTLRVADPTIVRRSMNWFVGVLHGLLNPNVAFLFLFLGIGLLVLEIFVPGGILGVTGGLLLILAVAALGMLPVQVVGLLLVGASAVSFIVELKVPGIGLPTAIGVVCLVAGGLLLFDPSVPNARVSPWMIGVVAVLTVSFFGVVVQAAIRTRRLPTAQSNERLIGREGTVVRTLDPNGVVLVDAEEWSAETDRPPIPKGRRVRVVGMEGLRLRVEEVSSRVEEPQGGS